MISCPNCGTTLNDSVKFCHVCGAAASAPKQAMPSGSEVNGPTPEQAAQQQGYYQNQQFNNNQNQFYGYADGAHPNMEYPPPPPYGAQNPKIVDHPTIGEIYSKSFSLLGKKPFLLWGLSLLHALLCALTVIFGVLPIISIPIILVLNVGIISVFLDGYQGKKISADQLFVGFKNFFHFCGGMAWMMLWIFLWGLIPVAGIVFAVIKAYSYRFVPYILLSSPEISATEALRESMKQTKGYCGRMFGADIIIIACIAGAYIILNLLAMIPLMGIIFRVIFMILSLVISIIYPLVFGIIRAAFYDEISTKSAQNAANNLV